MTMSLDFLEINGRGTSLMISGAGAVEYIVCHAEISVAFAEESKISEVSIIYIIGLDSLLAVRL